MLNRGRKEPSLLRKPLVQGQHPREVKLLLHRQWTHTLLMRSQETACSLHPMQAPCQYLVYVHQILQVPPRLNGFLSSTKSRGKLFLVRGWESTAVHSRLCEFYELLSYHQSFFFKVSKAFLLCQHNHLLASQHHLVCRREFSVHLLTTAI